MIDFLKLCVGLLFILVIIILNTDSIVHGTTVYNFIGPLIMGASLGNSVFNFLFKKEEKNEQ